MEEDKRLPTSHRVKFAIYGLDAVNDPTANPYDSSMIDNTVQGIQSSYMIEQDSLPESGEESAELIIAPPFGKPLATRSGRNSTGTGTDMAIA